MLFTDRIKQLATSAGTTPFTLGAAAIGYQGFPVSSQPQPYTAFDSAGNWETGWGLYNGTNLTRNVGASSNAGATIGFATAPTLISGMTAALAGAISGRNLIINGDFRVSQYYGTTAATPGTGSTYFIDRWVLIATQASKLTFQQVAAPAGFPSALALKVSVASAYAPAGGDCFLVEQCIEANNLNGISFGASIAKPLTLSFPFQTAVAGTYSGVILNYAGTRSYPFTFNIAAVNTPTMVVITIPGDVTGSWVLSGTGGGLCLRLCFGAGSNLGVPGVWAATNYYGATGDVGFVSHAGATAYIGDVQLEAGYVPTPFDRRQYGDELALCYRYAITNNPFANGLGPVGGLWTLPSGNWFTVQFPVTMRAPPAVNIAASFGQAVPPTIQQISQDFILLTASSAGASGFVVQLCNAEL